MLRIYNKMNIDSLDELISKFIATRSDYENLKNEFNYLNDDLKKVNKEYSFYKRELDIILNKIQIKNSSQATESEEKEQMKYDADLQDSVLENNEKKSNMISFEAILEKKCELLSSTLRIFKKKQVPLNKIISYIKSPKKTHKEKRQKFSSKTEKLENQTSDYFSFPWETHTLKKFIKDVWNFTETINYLYNQFLIQTQYEGSSSKSKDINSRVKKLEVIDLNSEHSLKISNMVLLEMNNQLVKKYQNEDTTMKVYKEYDHDESAKHVYKIEKYGMKNIFCDFWISNRQSTVSELSVEEHRVLGNKLIPHIKKFISNSVEDDFKK